MFGQAPDRWGILIYEGWRTESVESDRDRYGLFGGVPKLVGYSEFRGELEKGSAVLVAGPIPATLEARGLPAIPGARDFALLPKYKLPMPSLKDQPRGATLARDAMSGDVEKPQENNLRVDLGTTGLQSGGITVENPFGSPLANTGLQ